MHSRHDYTGRGTRSPACEAREGGSALVAVLVFITVVTVLVGIVFAVHVTQQRLVRQDVHRVQARYAAESAVYRTLADLGNDLRARQEVQTAAGGVPCSVRVEPFGGFARVRAAATVRGETVALTALAGRTPTAAFESAVFLGDPQSNLTVTGGTRIDGPITVSGRGVERTSFRGRPFTGSVTGDVRRRPDVRLPDADAGPFERTLDRLEDQLQTPPSGASSGWSERASAPVVNGRRVVLTQGSATLTEADTALTDRPVLVLATGSLTLTGSYTFAPGSIFVAGQTLTVGGAVEGDDGLFAGLQGVEVGGQAEAGGQFLSRRRVVVGDRARLPYPTVLYVGDPAGRLKVGGSARVDGLAYFPNRPDRSSGTETEVVIAPKGTVRGAVYSAARLDVKGTVIGTAMTRQFGFYSSPTYYVNWLKGATIVRESRPDPFVLPYGLDATRRPTVIRWYPDAPQDSPGGSRDGETEGPPGGGSIPGDDAGVGGG